MVGVGVVEGIKSLFGEGSNNFVLFQRVRAGVGPRVYVVLLKTVKKF
jgi:hypothetical protein